MSMIEKLAEFLDKPLDFKVSTGYNVPEITLEKLLETILEHKTLVKAAPVLGISRDTLTKICKDIFPKKENKKTWSQYIYSLLECKRCASCNKVLPLDEFANDKSKGKHIMCKPCLSDYGSARYYNGIEQHKEWQKNWRANNPTKLKEISARRRALKKAATPEDADLKLILAIYEHCPSFWQVDHIVPLAKGGLHHQDNLCYLYAPLNASKKDKLPEEVPHIMETAIYPMKEGWLV